MSAPLCATFERLASELPQDCIDAKLPQEFLFLVQQLPGLSREDYIEAVLFINSHSPDYVRSTVHRHALFRLHAAPFAEAERLYDRDRRAALRAKPPRAAPPIAVAVPSAAPASAAPVVPASPAAPAAPVVPAIPAAPVVPVVPAAPVAPAVAVAHGQVDERAKWLLYLRRTGSVDPYLDEQLGH